MDECKLSRVDGSSLDLSVYGNSLRIDDNDYVLFIINDIGAEKRLQVFEKMFFHDVLNMASAVHGMAEISGEVDEGKRREICGKMVVATKRLIDEIQAQRDLTQAENNELGVQSERLSPSKLVEETASFYRLHNVAINRSIDIDASDCDVEIVSDPILLSRVLGNMMKNALEAVEQGEGIKVGCKRTDDGVKFYVNNACVLPENIKLMMFKRSFSTKGEGRGVGTYSMKLLGERYLGGRVSFSSEKEKGTTFYLELPLELPEAGVD